MSQASHVGRETEITALGQTWRLARWERHVWEALVEWARPKVPDPLEVAKKALAMFPPVLHADIVRHALHLSSYALASNSPQVDALLSSLEGTAQLLLLLLKPNHPGIDEATVWQIMGELDKQTLTAALDRCAGRVPKAALPNESAPAG